MSGHAGTNPPHSLEAIRSFFDSTTIAFSHLPRKLVFLLVHIGRIPFRLLCVIGLYVNSIFLKNNRRPYYIVKDTFRFAANDASDTPSRPNKIGRTGKNGADRKEASMQSLECGRAGL